MELREDGNTVIVDSRVISGFLADDRSCQFCQAAQSVYFDEFDAYACPYCNRWLEEACGDLACDRCTNRAATPFVKAANSHGHQTGHPTP